MTTPAPKQRQAHAATATQQNGKLRCMGTFLAPFPSPQPTANTELSSTVASAYAEHCSTILAFPNAEFSSIINLLAMDMDDNGVGAGSQPNAPFAAVTDDADTANFPLLFAAHEHDHHQAAVDAMMVPLPPQIFADHLPVNPVPGSAVQGSLLPAGGQIGTSGSTSRSASKRRRRPQTRSSQSHDAPGESSGAGQAHAPDSARASRRVWVRNRSTEWWDNLDGPSCPDAEFRRAFRMSRATFGALCDAVGGAVAREDTALRAAVPVRQRVAVCLCRLATAEPLREVSRRFGLGISTCHSIVVQVYHALAAVLRPTAITWPDDPGHAATVAAKFEEAAYGGLPGIIGAVYTTRVPVVAPKANVAAYYDRGLTERSKKASYSVAVQVVSDANGAFTDVWIEPGSLSDAAILGRWALSGRLLVGGNGHGQEQRRLVGGTSYQLMDWMLVPYAHQNLTWAEHAFNERVAAARGVARGAVRRLKARWRCLQRRSEVKMQDLPSMIAACCVLHNVCERAREGLDPDLEQYVLDDDDGDVVALDAAPPAPSAAAQVARDRIAHGLLHGSQPR